MSSPFLSFDPFFFSFDLLIYLVVFIFFFVPFFMGFNLNSVFLKNFQKMIKGLFPFLEFKYYGLWGFLFLVFLVFSMINLFSLFCYVFSPTAHIFVTFSFGLLVWMSIFFMQVFTFFKRKMEHLAPLGTPMWLLFLMVLIELTSQLIRPVTLSVRLAANLTAGHLILSLLASVSITQSFFIQLPLILLELLVSIVQPFVFCMLLFLYFSEN